MAPEKASKLFFVTIILHISTVFLLSAVSFTNPWVYDFIPSTLISETVVTLPMLGAAMLTPAPLPDMLPFRRVKIRTLLLTLGMMAGLYPAVILINVLSSAYVENYVGEAAAEGAMTTPYAAMLLLVGIIGPFCEEIVFRGYIYQSLRRSGKIAGAVFLSSLYFGLMHMNFNQAAYATLIGVFLALLARTSGSLWPPVFAHVVFNSFEVSLMYGLEEFLQEETAAAAAAEYSWAAGAGIASAGAALSVLCLYGIRCLENAPYRETEREILSGQEKKPLFGIFAILSLIICAVFTAWMEGIL